MNKKCKPDLEDNVLIIKFLKNILVIAKVLIANVIFYVILVLNLFFCSFIKLDFGNLKKRTLQSGFCCELDF